MSSFIDQDTIQQPILDQKSWFRIMREVLSENSELVIGPAFTLVPQLFSLPLFIASILLTCQNIETSQLRYLLIASHFSSFIPQLISFFLYVSPSSFYSREWHATSMAKRIDALKNCHRHVPSTTSRIFSSINRKTMGKMEASHTRM
jgi:hypothetical protein